ncbi:hypothetical protein PAPHI01_1693, partial [Pancytospora philotis]
GATQVVLKGRDNEFLENDNGELRFTKLDTDNENTSNRHIRIPNGGSFYFDLHMLADDFMQIVHGGKCLISAEDRKPLKFGDCSLRDSKFKLSKAENKRGRDSAKTSSRRRRPSEHRRASTDALDGYSDVPSDDSGYGSQRDGTPSTHNKKPQSASVAAQPEPSVANGPQQPAQDVNAEVLRLEHELQQLKLKLPENSLASAKASPAQNDSLHLGQSPYPNAAQSAPVPLAAGLLPTAGAALSAHPAVQTAAEADLELEKTRKELLEVLVKDAVKREVKEEAAKRHRGRRRPSRHADYADGSSDDQPPVIRRRSSSGYR